jgi:16S rRNA processing protein RimM
LRSEPSDTERSLRSEPSSAGVQLLLVGRVAKAHGIGGELAVDVHTDAPDERFSPGAVLSARLRDRSVRDLTVSTVRAHSGRLLVRFEEVPDRTMAETLRGAQLLVDAADLPPSEDPDEFYDHELEGLTAVLADGTEVGKVREIARSPGAELIVIDRPDGREALVPFVREIVPEVDVPGGRLVLDPPDGLL